MCRSVVAREKAPELKREGRRVEEAAREGGARRRVRCCGGGREEGEKSEVRSRVMGAMVTVVGVAAAGGMGGLGPFFGIVVEGGCGGG